MFGSLLWWGHTKYEDGYKEGIAKYEQERQAHLKDLGIWEARVRAVKQENQEEIFRLNNLIERNLREYKLSKAKLEKQTKAIKNEIRIQLKPTDVVSVPVNYVRLYNDAICTGAGQVCEEAERTDQEDRSTLIGKSTTFAATTFADVTIGNVFKYNDLALRCNELIDIVKEIQDGKNSSGTEGQALDVRRDSGSGATRLDERPDS